MEMNKSMNLTSPDQDNQSETEISFVLDRLLLASDDNSDSQQVFPKSEVDDDDVRDVNDEDEDDDNDDDEDFTFMYVGNNDSADSVVFEDGEIRQVFPLFDQKLLFGSDCDVDGGNRLPIRPPVDKVFFESSHGSASETDGVATGPYCAWSNEAASGAPELNKKSNSTGFSKLWRFREKVSRSNSDGRDAFVFLNNSDRPTSAATSVASTSAAVGDGSSVKVNTVGRKAKVVKKGLKAKSATASAHEVYLRNRGGQTEDRRRSYLPYRPELMGFFTNVNGGLSRNVHPF